MNDELDIRTAEYFAWIEELKRRYRAVQVKAAVSVNSALLEFYWQLGCDISVKYPGKVRNAHFYENLSADLSVRIAEGGFSVRNLKYMYGFYRLYSCRQQLVADKNGELQCRQQVVADKNVCGELASVPWGHHILIMTKCGEDQDRALFYVRATIKNGWSRATLAHWISTDLYSREGKALTNFSEILPAPHGDHLQQLTKDPYVFEVQNLRLDYDEKELKKALVANVEKLLMEMGRGFSFVGREYPVVVGDQEKRVDLLFYHIPQHRYCVVEVKLGEFEPADLGQLEGYVAACDLSLNGPGENPAVGLVICKGKNEILVRYLLGKTDMPIGVTDYEVANCWPEDFKSDLPTVAEIEAELDALNELKEGE